MSDAKSQNLSNLVALSKLDNSLALIKSERTQLASALEQQEKQLHDLKVSSENAEVKFSTEQEKYQKEEKRIREESQKLVERRKALQTFSNYKVQQAAQKEIEQSAKQLGLQEEKLIAQLDLIASLEEDAKQKKELFTSAVEKLEEAKKEAEETFATLEQREVDKLKERDELVPQIPEEQIAVYRQVSIRFVGDSMVPLNDGVCSGCFVQVGPQMMVQISRGGELTKCRSCGRILYIEDQLS